MLCFMYGNITIYIKFKSLIASRRPWANMSLSYFKKVYNVNFKLF